MPNVGRSVAIVAAAIALVFIAFPIDVDAHAALDHSDPAAGAIVSQPPSEIRLLFTEPLESTYTGADLLTSAGEIVPGTSVSISPANARELIVVPPADLGDGGYTVAWRTLSAADGHTLQGYFGFRTGAGAVGETSFSASVTSGNETARAVTRWFALLGLAGLLAIAPVTLVVLDPARRAVPALNRTMPVSLRRYSVAAATLAQLGSVVALAAQAAAIAPDTPLPAAISQTLSDTRYGQLWTLRVVLLVVAAAAVASSFWGRERWRRPALTTGTALAMVMPVPFSLISHASALPEGRVAAIGADVLHLLGASVWAGGLFLLALVLVPSLRGLTGAERADALRAAIPRFSAVGLAAWGILALTGVYAAWLHVGSVDALRDTAYGQSLLLKLSLLVPILALAAFHLALGTGGLEPAREVLAARTPTQLDVPLTFATADGSRTGYLAISPGAAGVNTFTLTVDGPPLPADPEGVLRFALPDREIGEQELLLPAAGANRFQAECPELALAGDWRIEAIVRAIGAYSWTTAIAVQVGESPPSAPEPNPAPRFASTAIVGLLAIAVGIAGLALALTGVGAGQARRTAVAGAGAIALAVGMAIVVAARTSQPLAAPEAVIAQFAPVAVASPPSADHHEDMARSATTPTAGKATPASLPGPGTVVPSDGLTVAIAANPAEPGPVDVVVSIRRDDGVSVAGAHVAVLSEMAGMEQDGAETTAVETQPGEYVAARVPLSMSGEWRLAVCVSPNGELTHVVSFAAVVP